MSDYFDYKIGGLFKTYKEYLNSDLWKEKKKTILSSLGKKCNRCGTKKGRIDIHHLTYDRVTNEKLSDVIVLCAECHSKEHNKND